MVDYRKLLDAVMGAFGRPDAAKAQPSRDSRETEPHASEGLLQKAKDLAGQHPGMTQAALLGLAGLMFGARKKGRLSSNLAKLGGLAVIGGLAYKAFQGTKAGPAVEGAAGEGAPKELAPAPQAVAESVGSIPETSRFHPVSQTEDDALLFLRTMVAAAAADGHIDQAERTRIIKGLTEAGIDPQATHWLETEMASPADVEELAALVEDPEKAAQVYAAARIAIDPDTIQEREFLHQLAEALDLEQALRAQIDDTVSALR